MTDDLLFALAELAAAALILALLAAPIWSASRRLPALYTGQLVNETLGELAGNGSVAVIYTSRPVAAPWGPATCIEIVGGDVEPCGE